MRKSNYKYCVVPMCKSTTIKTPEKIFVTVPYDPTIRRKWFKAMKRSQIPSLKSHRHCCEDHFNIEEDTENYMRFKLMGGHIKIKRDVIPHTFACQKKKPAQPRTTGLKKQRINIIQDAIQSFFPQPLDVDETVTCDDVTTTVATQTDAIVKVDRYSQASEKKIIKHRSKSTSTNGLENIFTGKVDMACSPIKIKKIAPDSLPALELCISEESDSVDSDSSYDESHLTDDSSYEEEEDEARKDNNALIVKATLLSIKRSPKLFLGIPKDMYFTINLLVKKMAVKKVDILITLKKIKLDESMTVLAHQFGTSVSVVSRIFARTVILLDSFLKSCVFWPSRKELKKRLPVSFRSRYANVQSIIDCFEIEIHKPLNPLHQSLTWSEYKHCNTLKYLVSCTPDGLINFVSEGFGGRFTDSGILEESGYLDKLHPDMAVMADRGFKNVASRIITRQCELIRPPSVSATIQSTPEEVKQSKRIASLRIHIERVISRIREFQICKMHASTPHYHIPIMDEIVRVVCGLINLQDVIIKY